MFSRGVFSCSALFHSRIKKQPLTTFLEQISTSYRPCSGNSSSRLLARAVQYQRQRTQCLCVVGFGVVKSPSVLFMWVARNNTNSYKSILYHFYSTLLEHTLCTDENIIRIDACSGETVAEDGTCLESLLPRPFRLNSSHTDTKAVSAENDDLGV